MTTDSAVAWFLVALSMGVLAWTLRAAHVTSSVGRRWSMLFAAAVAAFWASFYTWVHWEGSFSLRRDVSRIGVVFTLVTFAFQAWAVIKSEPTDGVERE